MWRQQIVVLALLLGCFTLSGPFCAVAAPPVFYGVLVSYGSDVLTLMDKQGNKESYAVTRETLLNTSDGALVRLERLKRGTRLSVTAQSGRAVQISIREVPK